MIDVDFLGKLIRMVDESGLDSLELERGGTRIRLAKSPDHGGAGAVHYAVAPAPLPAPPPATPSPPGSSDAGGAEPATSGSRLVDVASPMVGTFYRAPAPEAPPYVGVGSVVGPGDTLCIIEAMKLMNELESEVSGRVAEIRVENGEPVEYGQVLFRIDPT